MTTPGGPPNPGGRTPGGRTPGGRATASGQATTGGNTTTGASAAAAAAAGHATTDGRATGAHVPSGGRATGTPSAGDRAATTPLGELLTDVTKDISTLFRQEVALAKAEISESAKKAGKGAGLLGGAGLTGFFALLFITIAAWWALGYLAGNAWSALIIAGVYLIITAILAVKGKKQLKTITGAPKTVATAKEIPDALKPNTRSNA